MRNHRRRDAFGEGFRLDGQGPIGYMLGMVRFLALILAGFLLLAPAAHADELEALVVGISDGDTVKVLVGSEQLTVRLDQIDAPEKKQAFGQASRQSLAGLVFRKTVQLVTRGHDRYGRTLATLYLDGLDVNAEQVRRGMAWAYVRYVRNPELFSLEREARAAGRGLWADEAPVAPWEFRHR